MAIALAADIDRRIRALPDPSTPSIRRIRQETSNRIRDQPSSDVLALALVLLTKHRWVAYELLYYHPRALADLTPADVEQLGRGINSWASTDAYARYISGPAWQKRAIPDPLVQTWAASPSRWWRRAALVSTVGLNLRAAGGTGDTVRTLDICQRLVSDRDDTVVKALSWALRELTYWDPDSVQDFLTEHDTTLAARVRREVTNKLHTGRKHALRP